MPKNLGLLVDFYFKKLTYTEMYNFVFLQIRKTGYSQAGTNDPNEDVHDSNKKIEYKEVADIRAVLRENEYLLHPHLEREHKSISGDTKLDSDLKNYTQRARALLSQYMARYANGELSKNEGIIITEQEKSLGYGIEVKSKAQIQDEILELIRQLDPDDRALYGEHFHKQVKYKTKDLYIHT